MKSIFSFFFFILRSHFLCVSRRSLYAKNEMAVLETALSTWKLAFHSWLQIIEHRKGRMNSNKSSLPREIQLIFYWTSNWVCVCVFVIEKRNPEKENEIENTWTRWIEQTMVIANFCSNFKATFHELQMLLIDRMDDEERHFCCDIRTELWFRIFITTHSYEEYECAGVICECVFALISLWTINFYNTELWAGTILKLP